MGTTQIDAARAKRAFLKAWEQGAKVKEACDAAGRSVAWYELTRKNDPDFKAQCDAVRIGHKTKPRDSAGSFAAFCDEFLGQKLYNHQLQWFDLLNGETPRNLHEAQTYERGDPSFLLVNTPPEHAKSTTLSINYPTWRICDNPNIRIILVSKTAVRAIEFLHAIKHRLTHPNYLKMQMAFGPGGNWKSDATQWAADRIYLGHRETAEKDPTVQAIGLGAQIYGSRADLILVDDAVVLSNAHEYEKQARWLQQEVITRLGPHGRLMVIGTRVDPMDLYKALREPERYPNGVSPWTYLAQPAVLKYAERPEDWETLWPHNEQPWPGSNDTPDPATGLYPRWDGRHLYRRRGFLTTKTWSLAYQQLDVDEDSVFSPEAIRRCQNGRRQPGLMKKGAFGHRDRGMDGLYVIAGLDPAMAGDTAITVLAVDKHTSQRYILACYVKPKATPRWILDTIEQTTDAYGVHEWRIEKNAFQSYLTQSPELVRMLASKGVVLTEHFTGKNKWDIDYGVASMAPIFDQGLIELPASHNSEAIKQLIEQLVTWSPETKNKTDLVMSLWFAEIRAREIIAPAKNPARSHAPNKWLSRRRKAERSTVNLNDMAVHLQR